MKILIADDHAILRAGLKHLLADYPDITVGGEAGNGHEALAKAQAEHWDVMLLDMTMPGMSGDAVCREMHALRPNVPVILSSGYSEHDAIQQLQGEGLAGFLPKPYRLAQLEELVGRFVRMV